MSKSQIFEFHKPLFFLLSNRNVSLNTGKLVGFPGGVVGKVGKEYVCQCRRSKICGLDPWVGKRPWSWKW